MQATTWVRKESEKIVANPALYEKVAMLPFPDVRACFVADAHSARYETHCSEVQAQPGSVGDKSDVVGSVDVAAVDADAAEDVSVHNIEEAEL